MVKSITTNQDNQVNQVNQVGAYIFNKTHTKNGFSVESVTRNGITLKMRKYASGKSTTWLNIGRWALSILMDVTAAGLLAAVIYLIILNQAAVTIKFFFLMFLGILYSIEAIAMLMVWGWKDALAGYVPYYDWGVKCVLLAFMELIGLRALMMLLS